VRFRKPALALLISAIQTLAFLAACSRQVWTASNVSSYVSQEVPDGSDRKQVTSFLDRRNIEHTDTAQDVVAVFRNKPSDTSRTEIRVTFHFGSDGKLASKQTNTVTVTVTAGQ
jgi:hypothetical protein